MWGRKNYINLQIHAVDIYLHLQKPSAGRENCAVQCNRVNGWDGCNETKATGEKVVKLTTRTHRLGGGNIAVCATRGGEKKASGKIMQPFNCLQELLLLLFCLPRYHVFPFE